MLVQEQNRLELEDDVFAYVQSEARDVIQQVVGQNARRTIRREYEGNGPIAWLEYTRNSDHVIVQLKKPRAQTNVWLGSL